MCFSDIRWTVGDGAGDAERMVLHRLVEQSKAGTVGGVDLRMEVPPAAHHHSQSLCSAPFILEVKPEPVLSGELIEHVQRDRIVPVVEAVSQPIRSSEFHGMLAVEIINILLEDLVDIPTSISKYHEMCQARFR